MFNLIWKTAQIKQKLIMINLLTTGVALLLAGWMLQLTEFVSFRDSLLQNLTAQAKILASNSTAPLVFSDRKAAVENLNALKAAPDITRAIIYGKGGRVFAEFQRPGSVPEAPPQMPRKNGYDFSEKYLRIFQKIELDGETIGTIYLRSDLARFYSMMSRNRFITALTLIIVLGIAFLLLTRLQKIITGPLSSLAQSMQTVSRDRDYTHKADVLHEDEIGFLAKGFNEMLEHIRKRDVDLQVEIGERKRAEEETRKLNEELELKVIERTSQLVEAQEELVRKEKLATLGQLAGSVGHELRNPLGVMNNAVYFLKTVMTGADETVREYLDIIKHEIDNSQRIITDLLDFSRTRPPQTRSVAACKLVDETLCRCLIPENVRLRTELPVSLPCLKVDPMQMGQVFQNIITNAVQAMPGGGSLKIGARIVQGPIYKVQGSGESGTGAGTPDTEPDGKYMEISVEDTGEGITPENLRKLFQPLFTTKARGIGLGLVVSRNLTEANGGRIKVESRPGEGTVFAVTLPVEEGGA
jgi:two-component system NtrC family sensor kinase